MYEKHNWVNGEVITEDKLNHLEDGVANGGSGGLIVNSEPQGEGGAVLDKTYKQIIQAVENGVNVVFKVTANGVNRINYLKNYGSYNNIYGLELAYMDSNGILITSFTTNSEDGYPSFGDGGGDVSAS